MVIRRGTVRSFNPQLSDCFALSYQAAKLFVEEFPDQYPLAKFEDLPEEVDINFVGPPNTIQSINYHEALQADEYLGKGFFRNKLVFVGVTTNLDDGGDFHPVPFTSAGSGVMSGVEVHVNATRSLLYGNHIKHFSRPTIISVYRNYHYCNNATFLQITTR